MSERGTANSDDVDCERTTLSIAILLQIRFRVAFRIRVSINHRGTGGTEAVGRGKCGERTEVSMLH